MDSDGAVHIAQTPTHRLDLSPAQWRARAPRSYDHATRAWLWNVRWRRRDEDGVVLAAIMVLVLLAHVAAFVLLRLTTATPLNVPRTAIDASQVMQVRLIDSPPPLPAPPPLQVLPPAQVTAKPRKAVRPTPKVVQPPPPPVMTTEATPMSTPPVHFYDEQGQVLLTPTPAPAQSVAAYHSHLPQGTAKLMHPPPPPITYTPTKLEKYFVPANETLLQKAVRKSVMQHTFHLPLGINITCAVSPLALAGGCGFTPPKQLSAPLRVKHQRDNLAPATPLIQPRDPAPAVSAAAPPVAGSVAVPAPAASVSGFGTGDPGPADSGTGDPGPGTRR